MITDADIELLGHYREALACQNHPSPVVRLMDATAGLSGARHGRYTLVMRYSWSIPTAVVVNTLAGLGPILDPLAGTGYWSHLLRLAGAEVYASDHFPAGCDLSAKAEMIGKYRETWHAEQVPWTDIADRDAREAVAELGPSHTLFVSWPPNGDPIAAELEEIYWNAGGDRLVYVGELGFGVTGDDNFHARLGLRRECLADHDDPDDIEWCVCEAPEARWDTTVTFTLPRWWGINDGVMICHRKEEARCLAK